MKSSGSFALHPHPSGESTFNDDLEKLRARRIRRKLAREDAGEPDAILDVVKNNPRNAFDRLRTYLNADARAGPQYLTSLETVQDLAHKNHLRLTRALANTVVPFVDAYNNHSRSQGHVLLWRHGRPVVFQDPPQFDYNYDYTYAQRFSDTERDQDLALSNTLNWAEKTKASQSAVKAAVQNLDNFRSVAAQTHQGMRSILVARLFRTLERRYFPPPSVPSG